MKRKLVFCEKQVKLCLSISIIVLFTADAVAAKQYSLQPVLSTSTRWDSNYFYESTDETSVYTWLVQPGFQFGYQAARTQLKFGATLDGHVYSGGSDDLDDFIGCTVKTDLSRATISRQLTFGLRDELLYTRNPEFFGEMRKSTSRDLYKLNNFNPYLEYEFDRFKSSFEYENIITIYDEDNNEDSALHKGNIKALYKMNRTFEFGPSFKMESMNYDNSSTDYQGLELGAILTRNGKFFDLSGGIGYHRREMDDAENSDLDAVSWRLALQSQGTGFKKTNFSLSLLHDMNDALTADGYYSALQIKGAVDRKVLKHLKLGFNASYEWDDYELTNREDDVWKIGAAAGYTINSWLEFKMEVGYQQQNSIVNFGDYENTSCMFKLNYIP